MIETHADVRAYFRERLLAVLERRRLQAAPTTEFYLVDLLARYAAGPGPRMEQPLALAIAEAMEAEEATERYRRFREVGDQALLACGFFAEHCERRGVSRRYVATVGSRAYRQASDLAPWSGQAALPEALEQLAEGFDAYAVALDDLRELTSLRTPQDIVRLYDRWRRSRSPLVAERLRALGVFPQGGQGGGLLH